MSASVQNPHIIGLTGSFGSGCTYIAENILVPEGYEKISLSDILKKMYSNDKRTESTLRNELQDFGDELRKEKGSDYLAQQAIGLMQTDGTQDKYWVIDSIRNPQEIQALRDYSRKFYLIGVYADKKNRWERVEKKEGAGYTDDQNAFKRDDQKDTGKDSPIHGQRVSDCFYEADIVLENNTSFSTVDNVDFKKFKSNVLQYVSLVQNPLSNKQATRPKEALMAMAYAVGQRSSCSQRKVGAVITDEIGNVISTGFNEVPRGDKPCSDEYKTCYRDKCRQEFFKSLDKVIPDFDNLKSHVEKEFKSRFRVLDICRALHAEENAIISLARHGRSALAEECTLYTTTYPCRLCANKITQLGIKRIVYLEPYPDEEAKVILDAQNVKTEFFEGITFRAYFRVYGDKK